MANLIMDFLTTQERILIIETYYNGRSVEVTFPKLLEHFYQHRRPTEPGIGKIVQRFKEAGLLEGHRVYQHIRPVLIRQNIAAVSESIREMPLTLTRLRSQELNIP